MSEASRNRASLGAKVMLVPTPVWLVGTYDSKGKPNVMTVAWGGVCCSDPPCVAIALRKATYTYDCILERRAFTVNIPGEDLLKQTDLCGILSGKSVEKFKEVKLTPVRSLRVDAPWVEECPLVIECSLSHSFELGLHTQFIGEIVEVHAKPDILTEGSTDMSKIRPMLFDPGTCSYFSIGRRLGKAFSVGRE